MMTSYDMTDSQDTPKYALTQFTIDEFFSFWKELDTTLDRVPHTWKHWTKEFICTQVSAGHIQVWGIGKPPKANMVFFTSIGVYPAMKVLSVTWSVGSFEDEMLPLLDATLTNFAQLNDCSEIEIRGRPGWESKLRPLGFRKEAVVMTRRVMRPSVN